MHRRHSRSYKPFSVRRSERKNRNRIIITFLIIAFLAYGLLAWILPTLISGLSIFNKFKSHPKVTQAVEDTTISPPVLNIPFEATNTASIKVKGYSQPNTKVEIYLDNELKSVILSDPDGQFITSDINLSLGGNIFSGKTIDENSHKSLASKAIKIIYDNDKPKLEVSSPTDGAEIKGGDKRVTVSGLIDPNDQVSVLINNTQVVTNQDGGFSKIVELTEGDNHITIMAKDSAGNITQMVKNIKFLPG